MTHSARQRYDGLHGRRQREALRGTTRCPDPVLPVGVNLAVFDALPVFRLGLLAVLGLGGRPLGSPQEVQEWLGTTPPGILWLTVDSDATWTALAHSRATSPARVVAVLPDYGVAGAARALRSGAVAVVPRDAPPEQFRRALDDVLRGQVTLPVEVFRAASARPRDRREGAQPTDEELGWLRALAQGTRVAELAHGAGYSERMMFRKLARLYARLDVPGRLQALVLARDEGWL